MVASQTLMIELVAKVDSIEKEVGKLDSKVSGFGSTIGKVGGAIAGAFAVGAVVDFGKQAVDAFSQLEQSVGGVEAVFGEASATVAKFGESSAETVGLSTSAFNQLSTSLGGVIKGSGAITDTEELASSTQGLITVAADLAATYGGTTQQAVEALGSAFRGEADPAERFNLNLKQSEVAAKAVELGLAETTSTVDEAAKAQAIMALIQEQSTDAMGQFGRESETVAGQQARLTAKWEDAQAQIGQALVPILLVLFEALQPIIDVVLEVVEALSPLIKLLADALLPPLAELVEALLPLLLTVLNPVVKLLGTVLTPIIEILSEGIGILVGWIEDLVAWLGRLKAPAWLSNVGDWFSSFGRSGSSRALTVSGSLSPAAASFTRATPRVGVSPFGMGTGGSGGPAIAIYTGVGDPVQIGREVVEAIRAYERTSGPAWRFA